MTPKMTAAAAVLTFAAAATVDSADARSRHHHSHRAVQTRAVDDAAADDVPARRPPIPYAYSFYPEEIEGGVSGNLPFNNQIRKSKDPLNANGGGG